MPGDGVLTRNDQLLLKATSKAERKNKIQKNKKKKKKAKGKKSRKEKKGNKKNRSKRVSNSPSKRRAILSRASSSRSLDADFTEEEPPAKKPKKGRVADTSKVAGLSMEGKVEKSGAAKAKAKASAKSSAKASAKAKAKAQTRKQRKETEETVPKPKAKAKAKAKAKGKPSKKNKNAVGVDESHPLFSSNLVETFMAFSKEVGGEGVDHKGAKFKSLVRSKLDDFKTVAYNVYWSRCSCGLTDVESRCDICNFSFSSSSAHESFRLACSVKSAEIAVTCL